MNNKKQIIIAVFSIVVMLIVSIGISYAYFMTDIKGQKENIVKSGVLTLRLTDAASNGVKIPNAYPMKDTEGMALEGYTFTLINTGTLTSLFDVTLIDQEVSKTRLSDNAVKYILSIDKVVNPSNGNIVTPGDVRLLSATTNRILTTGTIEPGEEITFTLKLWVDYDAGNEVQNTEFNAKISVIGNQTGIEE